MAVYISCVFVCVCVVRACVSVFVLIDVLRQFIFLAYTIRTMKAGNAQ